MKPVVGHKFELDMGHWGKQACEVLAVEPERLISYVFATCVLDTTITWRLVPEGAEKEARGRQIDPDIERSLRVRSRDR